MKFNPSTKTKFEFTGLQKGIPHLCTQGLNIAIITEATLVLEEFSEPQADCDGERTFFDYTFNGYRCTENGRVDKRQNRAGYVAFPRTIDTYTFILELLNSIESCSVEHGIARLMMQTQAKDMLKLARQRQKEEIERILA